jgi:hypothetical protein
LNVRQKRRHDIGEQTERQPPKHARIGPVRKENLQQHRKRGDAYGVEQEWAARQQLECAAHGGEIGSDVDRVGDEDCESNRIGQPARTIGPEIARKAFPGNSSDPGADFLNGRHERVGQQHSPEHRVTEFGSCLGVGGDAARIIV